MNDGKPDRQLRMNRRITRRDFLNGVAVAIGALGRSNLPSPASGLKNDAGDSLTSYAPALTGISIANSGAGASAYTNLAIDQPFRAIQQQLKGIYRHV